MELVEEKDDMTLAGTGCVQSLGDATVATDEEVDGCDSGSIVGVRTLASQEEAIVWEFAPASSI